MIFVVPKAIGFQQFEKQKGMHILGTFENVFILYIISIRQTGITPYFTT